MLKSGSIKRVRKLIGEQKAKGHTIGLVPTMGAFHKGHLSLIEKAAKECDFVVVSIFVNPAQFAPTEDYHIYPRDLNRDCRLAEESGTDLVFAPSAETIYPNGYSTYMEIGEIANILEGKVRPSHFRGVTTIVAKLFNIVQPDKAYFGQKDAQQLAIITKMVRELNYPIKVIPCPIVRDENGIALSSRHKYLTPPQMKKAIGIYISLKEGVKLIRSGISDFGSVRSLIIDMLNKYGLKRIDYVSFNKWDSLEPALKPDGKVLISLAVKLGNTRLIDNIIINPDTGL